MLLLGPPNVDKLAAKGDLEGLMKALHYKKDEWVRFRAARALADLGDAHAVEPLIAALSMSELMCESAAEALGKIGDARAVVPLIGVLVTHPGDYGSHGYFFKRLAVEALGRIGAPAVGPLITAHEGGNCPDAVEVLGEIGDARAVDPLIAVLKDNESRSTHAAAVEALGEIGDRRAVEPLITALEDEDWSVRQAGARGLGQLGDRVAVLPLRRALESAYGAKSLREAIEDSLKLLGGVADIDALKRDLLSNDARVRLGAVAQMGLTRDDRTVEPLIRALSDSDQIVCEAAAKAIERINRSAAKKAIKRLCSSSHLYWGWSHQSADGTNVCARCGYTAKCVNHNFGAWENVQEYLAQRTCVTCGFHEYIDEMG